ncbi:hypothetical protein [Absidia glauca]|uniref:Uncharacterized protein n=1 Tax=Absidia glauca TaxID=4829 RepID=A0A163K652_ABSGL|nr:hypothetical protein [Absidia glauca]
MTFSSNSSDVENTAIILAESHSTVIGDVARTTITEQQGKIQQQQGQQCEGDHHYGKNLSVYKQWNMKKWQFHELIIDYVTVLYVLLSDGYDKQERAISVDVEGHDDQDDHHGQRTDDGQHSHRPAPLGSRWKSWMAVDLNITQRCFDYKAASIGKQVNDDQRFGDQRCTISNCRWCFGTTIRHVLLCHGSGIAKALPTSKP